MIRVENVSRRSFLKVMGMGTGALVLGCRIDAEGAVGTARAMAGPAFEPNAFIAVSPDGTVTIVAHRSEMGQGSRTGLPMVVADEMEADWDRVVIVQADGDGRYGSQNTDGSRSMRQFYQPMREVGATARHMLVAAAATSWGVDASECEARLHEVIHKPTERSLGFGELAADAATLPVPSPESVELKSRDQFRYIGSETSVVDLPDFVTGRGIYGADVRLPDMVFAAIAHCPSVNGRAIGYDADAALAVPGVQQVVDVPGDGGVGGGFQTLGGVAVVADTTWAAFQGRERLAIQWEPGPHAAYDSATYRQRLEAAAEAPAHVVRESGDVDSALRSADRVVRASYYVPHLAQAPMEPPCATARFEGGRCEVWAPTQNPMGARDEVARALGIGPDDVTVHVTLLGGGFGRKSKPDYVVEAALVARHVGVPVQLVWAREDDIRFGYFHAVSAQQLEGGLDREGNCVAWLHRSVFPTIIATFNASARRASPNELGLGLIDVPFAVPNLRVENGDAEAHVRIGWMRSVSNIHHGFAVGSFVDELAAAAGRDAKTYLLDMIGPGRTIDLAADGVEYTNYGEPIDQYPLDTARLRNVIEVAAEAADWGSPRPDGRALGIAAHRTFLTYVAVVADVSVDDEGLPTVHGVYSALDCGVVVNRDRVRAQIEGAVIYGMSLALHGRITAREGAIEQSNFHDYPVVRMPEAPRTMEVRLIDSDALPTGVGEPGVPAVAPAITNAIYAASGKRIRELPILDLGGARRG
ncbi:MAG: xanthine dehydrogenase family protein molybdopterin-binding subunit [Gemmatimonadetes bacterium]|nr:xanthine dehydrogenase family protein molybdopterin-binding subunit [Gemmatimonadota bacterium]